MSTQNVTAPHRHTTRVAHSPSLTARQGRHLNDWTGEIPVVDYVGRHRKPDAAPNPLRVFADAIVARYAGSTS